MAKRDPRKLTDAHLRAWLAAGVPVAKADGDGLTFTLSARGTAAWTLRYSIDRRRKELTLGRYPDLSLMQARKLASARRLEVAAGTDVAVENQRRKAARRDSQTVRELVRSFESRVLPTRAASTAKCVRCYLRSTLVPAFGSWSAADISTQDVVRWLTDLRDKRSYYAADNARKYAAMVFHHGVDRHVVHSNPFATVRMRAVGEAPAKRERVMLTLGQISAFLQGLPNIDERDALIYRLLLATGVRGGELFGAEWVDVDLQRGEWRIPRHKIKTRKTMERLGQSHFVVPLSPIVAGLFKRLRELGGGSTWLIPPRSTRGHADRPADYERVLDRLKLYVASLEGKVPEITFHDLRSTMRSHLTDTLDVRLEVAERAINHQLVGLARTYDKSDYFDQRRDALRRWADVLDRCEAGGHAAPGADVVALREVA